MIRYKSGDVLQFKNCKEIRRYILQVKDNGYIFARELSSAVEDSASTNDPFFEDGWRIASFFYEM